MTLTYISLLIFIILLLIFINLLISPNKPYLDKVTPYECGFNPIHIQTRSPFTIQYYLVGLLFLAFDLEVILLFPLGFEISTISDYNFWIVTSFYLVLTLGFIYELGIGVIEFTNLTTSL